MTILLRSDRCRTRLLTLTGRQNFGEYALSAGFQSSVSLEMKLADGPWLQAAFFCREAEQTNEGWNFRGVHDGAVFDGRPDNYSEPVLVLAFTGGKSPTNQPVKIEAEFPDGHRSQVAKAGPLVFDGSRFGHTLAARIRIPAGDEGTIWFDVFLGDSLVTRMPFNVQHEHR